MTGLVGGRADEPKAQSLKLVHFSYNLFSGSMAVQSQKRIPISMINRHGYLHFSDPVYDGTGLTFLTDSGLNMRQENLYFYDDRVTCF